MFASHLDVVLTVCRDLSQAKAIVGNTDIMGFGKRKNVEPAQKQRTNFILALLAGISYITIHGCIIARVYSQWCRPPVLILP